jgi:cysteine desulfuration protein SufE
MKSIIEVQNQIVEKFSHFTDILEKYEYLIHLGKELAPLDKKYKTEEYAIKGCASTVWIVVQVNEKGKMEFKGDSDTLITKGILSLVLKVFQNQSPTDIDSTELYFADKIGLKKHLSPSRANGLGAMIKHVKQKAEKILISGQQDCN